MRHATIPVLLTILLAAGASALPAADPTPATAPGTPPAMTQEQVVAEIEKYGGSVDREGSNPTGPVEGVDFAPAKNLTDAILDHLQWLPQVQTIFIEDAPHITAAGLAHFGVLHKLAALNVINAPITDAGLAPLQGLTQLEGLDLRATKITDAGLVYVKGLTQLHSLDLSSTPITDAGLAQLKGLTQLQLLMLQSTAITDAGLDPLTGLSQLQFLNLMGTKVTAVGVKKLQQSLPKCQILR